METQVKKIAFFVLFMTVFAFSSFANGEGKRKGKEAAKKDHATAYQAVINIHRGNQVAVQFTKPSSEKVTIAIKDQHGKIVKFEKVTKHDLVVKKYVLNNLPAGVYTVEVKGGGEILSKNITVK